MVLFFNVRSALLNNDKETIEKELGKVNQLLGTNKQEIERLKNLLCPELDHEGLARLCKK